MPNMCYFQMKISGPEKEVYEFVEAIKWSGAFASNGLGRAFSFDYLEPHEIEKDQQTGYISVVGEGDCANSVLSSMREISGYKRTLESETKRLGVGVEYFSSETSCCFQEHGIIICGTVLESVCESYEEYYLGEKSEQEIRDLCAEKGLSREALMKAVNFNGEYCEGGIENFGVFSNLFSCVFEMKEKALPSLSEQIQSGTVRASESRAELHKKNKAKEAPEQQR